MNNIIVSNGNLNTNEIEIPSRVTPRIDYLSLIGVADSVEKAEEEYLEYEKAVRKTDANKFIWDLSDTPFENKANIARAWKKFQEWNLTDDGTPYYEKSKLWEIFANHTVFEDRGLPKPVLAEMGLEENTAPAVNTTDGEKSKTLSQSTRLVEMMPSEDRDWSEVFSTEVLNGLVNISMTAMARKLLQEIPEEEWPIGYELFKTWNGLRKKPSDAKMLSAVWTSAKSSEKQLKKTKEAGAINAIVPVKKEPRTRIAKCPVPENPVTFDAWADTISANFPDLCFAAETALSTLAQFLIKDITNPFALVLIDVPSSGKTIVINFFDDMPQLTYATDKFTPASFVSNAANVPKEMLDDIDLLPRIQYRLFLIRDLATLFSKREDDLNELLGILTRVLDGEGLNTDSGVHGQRQYNGEYLFMMLAASTPIPPRVMKAMGNLGSRLFFLSINSHGKDEDELAAQVADLSYKAKEKTCRLATRDFLYGLWNTYPQGIEWNKKADSIELLPIIARCAMLLASLRGVINVWHDDFNGEFKYATPIIERPDRINQLFYNLARGHALVSGRTQIASEDLKAIVELCVDGAPSGRAKLFRKLIEHGGTMTTSEIEQELKCSKPAALNEMKTLVILGVCSLHENTGGDNKISLSEDFKWFLSHECRTIRGIQAETVPEEVLEEDQ